MVDLTGRRFGDETSDIRSTPQRSPPDQRPRAGSSSIRGFTTCASRFNDFSQTVESGSLVWAETIESLAEATRLDADALKAELITVTAAAVGQSTDRFGRVAFEAPLAPPYAAVRVVPALFHTQGGLVVDQHARVTKPDGAPITGLYASGGAAAGISGHGAAGYLAGNGLLPALGLALLAAEHAARQSGVSSEQQPQKESA